MYGCIGDPDVASHQLHSYSLRTPGDETTLGRIEDGAAGVLRRSPDPQLGSIPIDYLGHEWIT